jgi:hypothetical protein
MGCDQNDHTPERLLGKIEVGIPVGKGPSCQQ